MVVVRVTRREKVILVVTRYSLLFTYLHTLTMKEKMIHYRNPDSEPKTS